MSKLAHFLLNLADSSFLDFETTGVLEIVFLKKNKRKKMSKLANFLLNLAESGFLEIWTPRVIETVFLKNFRRKNQFREKSDFNQKNSRK